jgi:hypothetical protein
MRRLAVAALVWTFCAGVVHPAWAQGVDELVAANLAAKGGAERLRTIAGMKQTVRLLVHGTEALVVIYSKRPNLLRQEITIAGRTTVNAFDGHTAWSIDSGRGAVAARLSVEQAEALRDQAAFDGLLVRFHRMGTALESLGLEMIGGRPAYHLRAFDGHRRVLHIYLDQATGLETRIVSESERGRFEQQLLDYRDVQGVKVPFTIRTSINGRPLAELVVEAVELGVALDDRIFRVPAPSGF